MRNVFNTVLCLLGVTLILLSPITWILFLLVFIWTFVGGIIIGEITFIELLTIIGLFFARSTLSFCTLITGFYLCYLSAYKLYTPTKRVSITR